MPPLPLGAARAAPGGTRGSGSWPARASSGPAAVSVAGLRPGASRRPGLDPGEPPVLDGRRVRRRGRSPSTQRALEQVRASSRPAVSRVSARASTPGEAVGRLGGLARASARRRSGCGRTASRSGSRPRRGCRRRGRPGRDDRPAAGPGPAIRAARSASKATDADTDSAVTVSAVPSRSARSAPCRSISRDAASSSVVVGGAARVEPGGHPRRHRVGAVRRDLDPPERRPLPGEPGLLVGGQRGHRVGQHRVVPVLHPGGAGVVRLAGEVEAAAAVRPDLAGHADRRVAVDQVAALLDVQLDEAADPVQPVGAAERRARGRRRSSRRAGVRRRGRAARRPAPGRSSRSPAASRGRPARSATPPPRRTRPPRSAGSGAKPRSRSTSIAASAETTPSGPSYAPPSRTESRCDPVSTAVPDGSLPPGDGVAVAVVLEHQLAGRALSTNQAWHSRSADAERLPEVPARGGRHSPAPGVPLALERHAEESIGSSRRWQADARRRRRGPSHIRSDVACWAPWSSPRSYAVAAWSAAYADQPVDPAVVDRMLAHAIQAP